MSATNSIPTSPESVEVVSWRVDETRKFKWKIDNFAIVFKSKQLLSQQRFEFDAGHSIGFPISWQCHLECSNNGLVGIFIRPLKYLETEEECNASYTFTINSTNGSKFFCGKVEFVNMMAPHVKKGGWGFTTVMDLKKLEMVHIVNKSLIFEIEFTVHSKTPVSDKIRLDVTSKRKIFESRSLVTLSNDLEENENLVGEMGNVNTTIRSMEGVEFPVNRGILAARSNVFRLMFQNKMKEAETGKVVLEDLSSKTVNVLLHYAHTGRLTDDWNCEDVIEELTVAAHRYEFKVLTGFLDDVLGSVCTMENAKRLALVAQKLGMKRAQDDLFKFIKKNAKSLEDLIFTDDNSS